MDSLISSSVRKWNRLTWRQAPRSPFRMLLSKRLVNKARNCLDTSTDSASEPAGLVPTVVVIKMRFLSSSWSNKAGETNELFARCHHLWWLSIASMLILRSFQDLIKSFQGELVSFLEICLDWLDKIYTTCLDRSILILIFIFTCVVRFNSLDNLYQTAPPAVARH